MNKFLLILILFTSFSFAQVEYFPGHCTQNKLFCAYFSPDDMPIGMVEAYLKIAKKSIKIATYNMNVDRYSRVIQNKLDQGVKVEFLVDYKLSFESNSVWRSLKDHSNLLKYRIPVLRGGNPQMHNKIIIIDDKMVLMGSANFTYSGLAGNYENVMAIGEMGMVQKFIDEFDELRNFSKIVCETMSGVGCGKGREQYPKDFDSFLKEGSFPSTSLTSTSGVCKGLVTGKGFLTSNNTPFNQSVLDCFKEKNKYQQLASFIAANEKQSTSKDTDRYQVYFSPEDNIQAIILRELNKTLRSPAKSFAYISTNFITNRNLAMKLVEMKRAGVRMKVFFDRGRYIDPNFQQSVAILKELGFTQDGDDENEVITIFDNQLVGPYGCNHNKMAVIGDGTEVVLVNGSANWSVGAMSKNDENLTVVKDHELAALYLREIISQLMVYRYGQRTDAFGLKNDINFLSRSVPCLKSYLGLETKCPVGNLKSTAAISVGNVPASENERVWAWVPQLRNGQGGAVEFYTHKTFSGRWIGAIPMSLNTTYNFKFFKTPMYIDPNQNGLSQAVWEFNGVGNDRVVTSSLMAVEVVEGFYTWGQP